MTEHVVVAGASGIVGAAAAAHFAARGFRVTALSRRAPLPVAGVRHRAIDLRDAGACAALAGELRDVTRLVYAALHEKPGLVAGWREADQIETNERMLANTCWSALGGAATGLRHVDAAAGHEGLRRARARASPSRPARTATRTRDVANFYWRQEELLRGVQAGRRGWHFTILRPQIIFGEALGAAMNLIPALGVYAALLKARRRAAARSPAGGETILEAVDADLLARVIDWAGECQAARDEAFNVTNGDVFTWRGVWPAIADALGMAVGGAEPERLAARLAGRAPPTGTRCAQASRPRRAGPRRLRRRGLPLRRLHLGYGRRAPRTARRRRPRLHRQAAPAGFGEAVDTEAMLRKWVAAYQDAKLLPPR